MSTPSRERRGTALSGWLTLPVLLGAIVAMGLLGTQQLQLGSASAALSFALVGIASFCLVGHYTLQPNEAAVMTLFGAYRGTVKTSGFHFTNPLNARRKISLRSRNLNGDTLKVNDRRGNPVEISAVLVWKVSETYRACFEVDNYDDYVRIQSESAVRSLASRYAYDHGEQEDEITLRGHIDEVAEKLRQELQERLASAGVIVEEARINHLAYAPEIAGAMLKRQQADAIIAARERIVHGAVSMVHMALEEIRKHGVLEMDDERKAAMVSNLLVVLCGETEAQPVINAGTLHT